MRNASKAHQYIIKAAALRAQADKLEKVAVLIGQDVDSGSGSTSTAAKVGIGLGAGALGLGAGSALGLGAGSALGLGAGSALTLRRRANDIKNVGNAALASGLALGGVSGISTLVNGGHPAIAGLNALLSGVWGAATGHHLASLWNNTKDYMLLKKFGLL